MMSSTNTPKCFSPGLLPTQPAFVLGLPGPRCRTCTSLCWTSWGMPKSQACWDPSGWHPFLPASGLHHRAWCYWWTWWEGGHSLCPCVQKRCLTMSVPILPPRNTTHLSSPHGQWATDLNPLSVTSQPVPYPLHGPPIWSTSLQFENKAIMKCFVQLQVDNINHHIHSCQFSPLISQGIFLWGRVLHIVEGILDSGLLYLCSLSARLQKNKSAEILSIFKTAIFSTC